MFTRIWKFLVWTLVWLAACDSGPNGTTEQEAQPIALETADQVTIEHGNQSIRVQASGELTVGRWVPDFGQAIDEVYTFAAGDL